MKIKHKLLSYDRVNLWATASLIAIITLFVYLPALENDFVNWDDEMYVYENPHIKTIDSEFIKWVFTSFYASNWHPLTPYGG
jgi:hypothetical protein